MARNKNPILNSFGNVNILEVAIEIIEKRSPVKILYFLSQYLCYDVAKNIVLLMLLNINNKLEFNNLDMSYLNLNSCNFSEIVINESDFSNTILKNIDISYTTIKNTFFTNSKLININFESTNITSCGFNGAIICGSNFQESYINSSDMTNTQINNTYFYDAHFFSVCLQNALFDEQVNLENVRFIDCNSRGANCNVPKINGYTGTETSGCWLSGGGFSTNATATRFVFV